MADDDTIEMKTPGLDKLLKAMKVKLPVARVGILGNSNAREGKQGSNSNATIGAVHEFGTSKVPQRSFLRVPISDNLGKRMEASGALDKSTLENVIKSGTLVPWLTKVAILAQGIVLEAFDSAGFGKWKPLQTSTMNRKKVKQILVESQQLRNSITYEVKE